jgi:hypothetical protein
MSRTYAHRPDYVTELPTPRRGQVKGAPPVRRTGTRAAVVAAALAEYEV